MHPAQHCLDRFSEADDHLLDVPIEYMALRLRTEARP